MAADPRILDLRVPVVEDTTLFQVAFGDGADWDVLLVDGEDELDVGLSEDRLYRLDGVNAVADDEDSNSIAASTPPMQYKVRVKNDGLWTTWSPPVVYPSLEDFVLGMQTQLKDPILNSTPGPALLTVADYKSHAVNAIAAFEKRHPRILSELYDMTSGVLSYALPEGWAPYASGVVQVEYPVGSIPRNFIYSDYVIVDEGTGEWRFRRVSPSAGETSRLFYHVPHLRDGSSIPQSFYAPVLMWAVGDAAQQLWTRANQFGNVMVGADYVEVDPRIREWGKIAKEWKAQAEKVWGSGATGLRVHLNDYEDHGRIVGVW